MRSNKRHVLKTPNKDIDASFDILMRLQRILVQNCDYSEYNQVELPHGIGKEMNWKPKVFKQMNINRLTAFEIVVIIENSLSL